MVKTIGVVGGMGPLATIEFLRHLVKSVSVENESDFPRIVSDINPNIPSRTRHVLFEGQDFVPAIADSAKNLQRLGAQFIVVPCNSAQYKLDKMRSSIELPVLSIFESVVNDLDARSMNVMVLGGPVTFQRESYREPIEKSGRSYFSPASRLQEMVEEIIYSTKIGKPAEEKIELLNKLIDTEREHNQFDTLALACTELSEQMIRERAGVVVLDSSLCYARAAARFSYKQE